MKKAGFIGLGIMGKPMAKNLLKGGCELLVNDLNEAAVKELVELGAKKATLAEIGEQCEVVLTILPNGAIVQNVLFRRKWCLQYIKTRFNCYGYEFCYTGRVQDLCRKIGCHECRIY